MTDSRRRAFTLIELLIVVAIIAILAAIAVPNFLEAQVRSKVSRARADMRALKTALEAYAADFGKYPMLRNRPDQQNRGGIGDGVDLTTPVAYITSVGMPDPFRRATLDTHQVYWADIMTYAYVNINLCREEGGRDPVSSPQFLLFSWGPDFIVGPDPTTGAPSWYADYAVDPIGTNRYVLYEYDPTNGTKSPGDILVWQG
ncbi:MAG TPA: prepilin-type N-terminal cleavage/methylation domain-containing protein [Sumerlaeia bacterium]|nr:prepilin-type N-terminal cleavage/methylation domain-containing protein [Sumerlaeia bacterium]